MKGPDVYQDAILKLITGNCIGDEEISAICNVYDMSSTRLWIKQETKSTHAILTSSIFNGPVGGKPRIVLSELDPTKHESSSLSLTSYSSSLALFHLFVFVVLFVCSLHSKPYVECSEEESLILL